MKLDDYPLEYCEFIDILLLPVVLDLKKKLVLNKFDFLFRLNNLFTGLPSANSLRFDAYIAQLRLASNFGFTDNIETQLKVVSLFH